MGAGAYYGIDVGTVLDEWLPDDDEVTQRLTVQLQKPLGLILEESDLGGCFIAELLEGGAAEKGRSPPGARWRVKRPPHSNP